MFLDKFRGVRMKRYIRAGKYSLIIMLICTTVLILNTVLPLHLNQWGILPRATSHLSGILFSPFLHENWAHLLSNFIPFVVFGMLVGEQGPKRFLSLFVFFTLTTGTLVWLFARGNSVHIGMSGVIYAFWGYLVVYGLAKRQIIPLIISLLTLFFYGGLIIGVFPTSVHISFESHLLGAVVGGFTGYYLAKR